MLNDLTSPPSLHETCSNRLIQRM